MGRVIRIGAIYLACAALVASCDPADRPTDAPVDEGRADAGPLDEPEDVPPLDRSGITRVGTAYDYLIEGDSPRQGPVAAGTIDSVRAGLVRGTVRDHFGAGPVAPPLADVQVSVLGHPEYGTTATRRSGAFRFLVNGGEDLVLEFRRDGYLLAQRRVYVAYNAQPILDDVHLVLVPSTCASIDGSHRFATVSSADDARGPRTLRVYVPEGIRVQEGATPIGTEFTLCGREYTEEPRTSVLDGESAMPGSLPETSAYTFAAELIARRPSASGVGAEITDARFDGEGLTLWLDNFLGFAPGTVIPHGSYDAAHGRWVPESDGRVVAITRSASGECSFDGAVVPGAEAATVCDGLEIPSGETHSYWRVAGVTHFSAIDLNLAALFNRLFAVLSALGRGVVAFCGGGSTVFCESQAVGEMLPITGTPYQLTYSSERQRGREIAYTVAVDPLGGATELPSTLRAIWVHLHVAGRVIKMNFEDPSVLLSSPRVRIVWDGTDAEGRVVLGPQPAVLRVGYIHQASYGAPPEGDGNFGRGVGLSAETLDGDGRQIIVWQSLPTELGTVDDRVAGIGGWNVDVHHVYDRYSGTVWTGGGRRVGVTDLGTVIESIGPTDARRPVFAIAAEPSGAFVYLSEDGLYRVESDGSSESQLCTITGEDFTDVAVSPDGPGRPTYYLLDQGRGLVYRFGREEAVGGLCSSHRVVIGCDASAGCATGAGERDDGPAEMGLSGLRTDAPRRLGLGAVLQEIAVGSDGSLFVADTRRNRILRVVERDVRGDSSLAELAVGAPTGCRGDGPTCSPLLHPLAVAAGPSDLFTTTELGDDSSAIVRVDWTGTRVVAGGGTVRTEGAAGPDAHIPAEPLALSLDGEGRIHWLQRQDVISLGEPAYGNRIRMLDREGRVRTVGGLRRPGDPTYQNDAEGTPATATGIGTPTDMSVSPDGSVLFGDLAAFPVPRPRRVVPHLSGGSDTAIVSSPDGSERWIFDSGGRHLRTVDALTEVVLATFSYEADGALGSITDIEGRELRIDAPDVGTAGPATFSVGSSVTRMDIDAAGDATAIRYARAAAASGFDAYTIDPGAGGLITQITDPDGDVHSLSYTPEGLLLTDDVDGTRPQRIVRLCPGGLGCQPGDVSVARTMGSGDDALLTTVLSTFDGATLRHSVALPNGIVGNLEMPLDGVGTRFRACDASDTNCDSPHLAAETTYAPDPRPERLGARYAREGHLSWIGPDGITPRALDFFTQYAVPGGVEDAFPCTADGEGRCSVGRHRIGYAAESIETTETLADGSHRVVSFFAGATDFDERDTYHPSRRRRRTLLDAMGRPVRIESPGRHPSCLAWDDFHLTSITQSPDSAGGCATAGVRRTTSYTWDDDTRYLVAATTGPGGAGTLSTSFGLDERGWAERITLPGDRIVRSTFDGEGMLSSVVLPNGAASTHAFTYDDADEPETTTLPAVLGYGPAPLVTVERDTASLFSEARFRRASGTGTDAVVPTYDRRTPRVTSIAGGGVTYRGVGSLPMEDWSGRLRSITDGRTSLVRDADGPFVGDESWTLSDGSTARVARTIDDRMTLTEERVTLGPNEHRVGYVVRDDGELDEIVAPPLGHSELVDVTYTAVPSTRIETHLGVTDSDTVIDGFGELVAHEVRVSGGGRYSVDVTSRDADGRITARTERWSDSALPCSGSYYAYAYTYDAAGRLRTDTRETRSCATDTVTATVASGPYLYDANGNRTDSGLSANAQDAPTSASRPRTYDARGRLSARGSETFTHDIGDQLVRWTNGARVIDYEYDGVGRLVRIAEGADVQRFFYRDGLAPIAWQHVSGGVTRTMIFGYGLNEHVPDVAWVDATSNGTIDRTLRFATDERGSVRTVFDADSGVAIDMLEYDAWGQQAVDGSTFDQPFGYAGAVRLSGPELWHMGARNLDPSIGRFITPDTWGFEGGLNLYDYGGSDPIDHIDPSGHIFFAAGVALFVCGLSLAVNGGDIAAAAMNIYMAAWADVGFAIAECRLVSGVCFGEGTPVQTADGLRPIESIEAGDLVWAMDPETGEEDWREVLETFVHPDAVLELAIEDGSSTEVLTVTGGHPFWERERGWTPAGELLPGDEVFTSRGGWARISGGTWIAGEQLVYNFEVEGAHTYFVGETGAWVHNACTPHTTSPSRPPNHGTTGTPNSIWEQVRTDGSRSVTYFDDLGRRFAREDYGQTSPHYPTAPLGPDGRAIPHEHGWEHNSFGTVNRGSRPLNADGIPTGPWVR